MALTKCKECGHKISKKAKACPGCGATAKKRTSLFTWLVAIFIGAPIILASLKDEPSHPPAAPPKQQQAAKVQSPTRTPEELRTEKIRRQFSGWDGSHSSLERLIKDAMNDPDSYEHVETTYWDEGDHLIVKTSFRGKNAFGGVVLNWVKAKVDMNGNVIEVIEQNP